MRLGQVARPCVAAVILCFANAAWTASAPPTFRTCVTCHGVHGEGNPAVGAPAIAGQRAAYLERQLRNFRSGLRGTNAVDAFGTTMRAVATTLPDDRTVTDLAAYLAGLPQTTVRPAAGFDPLNGNNLYQGKCGACHGSRAEGNDALATPRLVGLEASYFRRQFANFRQGMRGAHPQDRFGKQMSLMATTVPSEKDLGDVIAYVQALGATR